ncbi:hypothetical protein [Paenibacillus kandeliae]|uniref:hypothetical protein n=1 Tax=Paenibacillus kandeliae TaxID=3231269 RepID=UPI00345AF8F0
MQNISVQQQIIGKWIVKDIVANARITMVDKASVEKWRGSFFEINEKGIETEPSVTKELLLANDQNTTPVLENPYYDVTNISEIEEEASVSPSTNQLGFQGTNIYRIDIYKDKDYEDQWSLGILLFDPSMPDRLILSSNGFYYELKR